MPVRIVTDLRVGTPIPVRVVSNAAVKKNVVHNDRGGGVQAVRITRKATATEITFTHGAEEGVLA